MPGTYQKTVNIDANPNNSANPDFSWVIEPSSADAANGGWVTLSASSGSNGNTTSFEIADQPNGGLERTCTVYARHWNYDNDNSLQDSFTITQSASGVVVTTTLPTFTCSEANVQIAQGVEGQAVLGNITVDEGTVDGVTPANYVAGTNDYDVDVIIPAGYQNAGATITCENISATATTTTAPPVNYTLTLASGTSGAQAVQFTEATPNSQSINYTQSPNTGTPAVLVDSLPAWLTSGGITGSAIQLSLNADSSTYPTDSVGFSMTYRHGDAPAGQGEDELYVSFIAAPNNSILITSGNVTISNQATGGEGGSQYIDNNSGNSATQAVVYEVTMDPYTNIDNSSYVYWSETLPSASGHTAHPQPYWATAPIVNDSVQPKTISFNHVDPSGGLSLNTNQEVNGNEGASTMSTGPSPGLTASYPDNLFLIVKHPDDLTHWCAIQVTPPTASTTTTMAPVTRTFTWDSAIVTGYSTNYPITFNYTGTQAELLDGSFSIDNGTGVATSMSSNHPGNLSFNPSTNVGTAYFRFLADDPEGTVQEDIEIRWTKPSYVTLTSGSSGNSSSYASGLVTWTPTCVVENEPILMADGTTKLVQDIVLGDELASLDIATLGNEEDAYKTWSTGIESFSATGTTATVTRFSPGQYTKYMNFNSGALKITHEHPVLIDRAGTVQFISAGTIQVGDKFYQDQTGWVEITSAEEVNETVKTYMIGCEDADVFYANGILVHNVEEEITKE